MHLVGSEPTRITLALTQQERVDLYHMAMTANLVFDELDTVPYDATQESVSASAAFLEGLAEDSTRAEAGHVEMAQTVFDDIVSTIYTLDISFHPPDGNPFGLTQAMITDYGRRLMWVQDAVVKQIEAARP